MASASGKGGTVFLHKGISYSIDHSKKIASIGDFDERKKIILIDRRMPKKFFEGIALHEIIERVFIKRGYSYGFSHNRAQKAELKFYQKIFGRKGGRGMLVEEEKYVLGIFDEDMKMDMKNIRPIKKVVG